MTNFERRQRMDERNRLYRMYQAIGARLQDARINGHKRDRLNKLARGTARRYMDLTEELGLR